MGNELTSRIGKYWVLYFQPLPEAGERIAIALVFEDGKGTATLEYDPKLSKVARLFPDIDPEGLTYCLERIRTEAHPSNAIESALNAAGPQLTVSEPRRIAIPPSRSVIDSLMARYIYPAKRTMRRRQSVDNVAKELEAFVRASLETSLNWRTDVGARDIVGHYVTGTRRIALALENPSGWTLVDGVDLNQLSPADAARRADEIARTYWNYGRAVTTPGMKIRRVGIVLNGNSHLAPETHEAHDYALHRFQSDSDLAIDASSSASGRLLKQLVESAG